MSLHNALLKLETAYAIICLQIWGKKTATENKVRFSQKSTAKAKDGVAFEPETKVHKAMQLLLFLT